MNRDDAPETPELPEDERAFDNEFDAPATEEELAAAAALARALEALESPESPLASPPSADPQADEALFAEALRHAYAPTEIADDRLDALVEAAIDSAMPKQRGRVIRVAFGGGAAVLAMAAAAAFFLQIGARSDSASSVAAAPALTAPRSAQDLFDEPFPRTGGTSERVDRIASARERELRANRYAAWGVR